MNEQYQNRPPANGLAIASLVLGIASLLFVCCGTSFFFSAPGIVLALLSRGSREMDGPAKAGLILSVIGLVLSLLAVIFMLSGMFLYGDFAQGSQEITGIYTGPI